MRQVTINHTKDKVFKAVKKAARNLNLNLEDSFFENGTVLLSSHGGLFSFGNNIKISLKAIGKSKTVMKVVAKSSASIQIVDWGTNSGLENDIIEEVRDLVKQ